MFFNPFKKRLKCHSIYIYIRWPQFRFTTVILFTYVSELVQLTTMSLLSEYERQMFLPESREFFILPRGSIVLRNIDKKGRFVSFRNFDQFKSKSKPMWWSVNFTSSGILVTLDEVLIASSPSSDVLNVRKWNTWSISHLTRTKIS